MLIIFTSKTFQPRGLCQLLTRSCEQLTKGRIQEWWCPRGSCLLWWTEHTHTHNVTCDLRVRSILLMNIINSCVVAHQFVISVSRGNYMSLQNIRMSCHLTLCLPTYMEMQTTKDTRLFWMATGRWWEHTTAVLLHLIHKSMQASLKHTSIMKNALFTKEPTIQNSHDTNKSVSY